MYVSCLLSHSGVFRPSTGLLGWHCHLTLLGSGQVVSNHRDLGSLATATNTSLDLPQGPEIPRQIVLFPYGKCANLSLINIDSGFSHLGNRKHVVMARR